MHVKWGSEGQGSNPAPSLVTCSDPQESSLLCPLNSGQGLGGTL